MRRILMNAADPDTTGSGGGAVVPPAAAPAPSTPPAPPSVETLLAAMDDPKLRDSFFAEMRRSGRIKGASKPAGTETTTPEPAPATKAPETEMVSRADLARERAFNRSIAVHGQGLTERQLARMERSFESETPSDVGEWVAGYIADLGLKPTVAATTVTNPAPQPQNPPAAPAPTPAAPQPPVTNVGAPAAPNSPLENRNLMKLTKDETAALIKQHGAAKVMQMVREQMRGTGFRTK